MRRLYFTGYGLLIGSFFSGLVAGSAGAGIGVSGIPARLDPPAVLVRLAPGAGLGRVGPGVDLEGVGRGGVVLAVEAPFSGPADPGEADEPLFRIRRLVLAPGVDAAAAARSLRDVPGVEAAWVERRYRVAWADALDFLGPMAGRASGDAGSPVRSGLALLEPNDPQFIDGTQWGLRNDGLGPLGGVAGVDIRAQGGWDVTTGSTTTIIAIIDTGMDLEHPELAGVLADGSSRIVRSYNSSVEPPGASAADSVGHGTIVAGVALARTNNGPQLDGRGVAGVAGGAGGDSAGCRVLAIKATPTHLLDALSSELAEGIFYAVTRGARAINLSFGGDEDDDTIRAAISYAARRGCVVVCGAGNGQDARPQYPGYYARYGAGISVAALDSRGLLARFSSRGPQIDVAAPGVEIQSTYLTYANAFDSPTRNYARSSGTSFAAPFVTGLAGLVTTLQPSLTDNEFQQLLRHTARDLGEPGRDDTYGWGIPDADALLHYAAPPRGFVRGEGARAQSWSLVGTDTVTLDKTNIVVNGCTADGRYAAERWEVRTHVPLPAGRFLETPLGMARTHSTRGWTAGPLLEYDLGYGEVVPGSASPEGFTLRTYVYLIAENPERCSSNVGPIGWVPSRPESVTFGWSAFGRVDAAPVVRITAPDGDGALWSADAPETLRWEASDPDHLDSFEVSVSRDGGSSWRRAAVLPGTARQLALAAPCGAAGAVTQFRVLAQDLTGGVHDEGEAVQTVVPSRLCLPGEEPTGSTRFAFFPVAPNPARDVALFRYERFVPLINGTATAAAADAPATVPGPAVIVVRDVKGRRLRTLDLSADASGLVAWDGRDETGRHVPGGVYFAQLRADGHEASRRFVLLGTAAP